MTIALGISAFAFGVTVGAVGVATVSAMRLNSRNRRDDDGEF